jgi:hypothetical protein
MDHTPHDVQIDMAGLWKDLQRLICAVVEQMNHDEELRQRTGGLDFQHGPSDMIVVKKQSFPAVNLTLTRGTAVIAANYRIVISGPNARPQETRESLCFEIDKTRTSLCRNNHGESFTIEQVVFYILRPFLRPAHLI